jgi:DNA-directed RNA polymerase subunit M/transcription elongation factor TFIIS
MSILSFFKKNNNPHIVEVKVIPIAGKECPKCKSDGALFHYKEGEISSHSEEFYLCENCCNSFDKHLNLIAK